MSRTGLSTSELIQRHIDRAQSELKRVEIARNPESRISHSAAADSHTNFARLLLDMQVMLKRGEEL